MRGQDPVAGMVLAALLTDAAQERICPLVPGRTPREGDLRIDAAATRAGRTAVLVEVGGLSPFASPVDRLLSALGLGLVFEGRFNGSGGVLLAVCGILWLLAEGLLGPPLMERIRQAPARQQGLAPPLSWRRDTFCVVWAGQALLWAAVILVRLIKAVTAHA